MYFSVFIIMSISVVNYNISFMGKEVNKQFMDSDFSRI